MAALSVTLNENAGLTDIAGGVTRAITLTLPETSGITDAAGGFSIGKQITLEETLGLTDAGAAKVVVDTINESAGLTDNLVKSAPGGSFTITFNENLGLTDMFSVTGGSGLQPGAPTGTSVQRLPTPVVEVGFEVAPDVTGTFTLDDPILGLLDGAALLAEAAPWSDVSAYVRRYTIVRGVERVDAPILRYTAGNLTMPLKNADRRFDPTNMAGPYVANGQTQVEPMRPVRVRVSWQGQEYWLFSGYADLWDVTYGPPSYSECLLTATDGFKVLEAYDRAEQATAVGAGEMSGARVHRLLDAAGWPAEQRAVDAGTVTLQPTTLAGTTLAELQLVADTEGGDLLMDPEGIAVFAAAYGTATQPRGATSQATFGDDPAAMATGAELPYADVTLRYDDAALVNVAQIGRAGSETVQEARNEASAQKYLPHAYQRTDLLFDSDLPGALLAADIVDSYGTPELRFTELVLRPQRDPSRLFPQALGRRIGDRVTIIRRPPGGGSPVQRDVVIRGIRHETDGETWMTTFTLGATYRDDVFVLDHPTLGLLDTSRIT